MKKYLFLDFDGVLNTEHYQNVLMHEGKALQDRHGAFFDPETVEQLRRIINETHADIVVSSSWKYYGLDAMQDLWEARQMPGKIIDITPSAVSDNWLLTANLDDLAAMKPCKGMEIVSWLADNADKDAKYVIIDDEYVILDSQVPYFILTNPFDGITQELADRAIRILNN
jgi:histidinol phosphatase-like enzyme